MVTTNIQHIEWVTKRLLFMVLYFLLILTGGISMFITAPLTSYLLFRDVKFWRYTRYFFPFAMLAYHQLALLITDQRYRTMFSIPFTAPPMRQPDKSILELSESWDSIEHECSGCSNCCVQMGCPLLDWEQGKCMSYNSFFWNYFNCGRYPATKNQIDYYQCPKWMMKESAGAINNISG